MSTSPRLDEGIRPQAGYQASAPQVIRWLATDLAAEPAPVLAVASDWLATRLPEYVARLKELVEDPEHLSATLVDIALAALQSGDELSLYEYWDAMRELGRQHCQEGFDMESMLAAMSLHRDVVVEVFDSLLREVGAPEGALDHVRHRLDLLLQKLTVSLTLGYVDTMEQRYQEQRGELQALMAISRSVNRSLELPEVAEAGLTETLRAMRMNAAALWLTGPDGDLALVHTVGLAPRQADRLQHYRLPGVRDLKRALQSQSGLEKCLRPAFRALPRFRSRLIVPLRAGMADLVGILALGSDETRQFPDTTVAFVGAVAEHLVVAVEHARQLQHEARTDFLTGLANRKEFERAVGRHIAEARQNGRPLTLALLDLDNLKTINDSSGHHVGDQAIRSVGEALRHAVRASDVSARLGGDEFGISFPDLDVAQAEEVANRIRESLRARPAPETGLSVSVGFAAWRPELDWAELFRDADRALYRDKRRRRTDRARHHLPGATSTRPAAHR